MAHEIELKLSLPEAAQRAFLRHPLLKTAASRHVAQLTSIYYDTPDLALRRSGIALRLRRHGRTWLQTVKCAGDAAGGLSSRPEWESRYTGHFDFAGIDDEAVRTRLTKRSVASRLAPVFETSFRRTTWQFDGLQLMFDRGWIVAGGRRAPISELELELAGGQVGDIFVLAEALGENLPLLPGVLSKADRGIRLFQAVSDAPTRAAAVPLTPGMTSPTAFRAIALSCLDQMLRNQAGAAASDDPEYIHQLRVGTRRLRAAIRLFAPHLHAGFTSALLPSLRETMAVLGAARDLDVLLAEIAAPVSAALPDEPRLAVMAGAIAERRYRARRRAVATLESPAFARMVLRFLAMLHQQPFLDATDAGQLGEFAKRRLGKLNANVRRLAGAARTDDPASLHALRIGIKRLRYALEFFAPLADNDTRQCLAARLARAQTVLGELNDLANAGTLLMECAGNDARLREAVALIGGWHGPRHARLMKRLPKWLNELRRLPRTR